MPFNGSGVYTPATGATTASPGALIQSAIWNNIFTDISSALTTLGAQLVQEVQFQASASAVNFNAINTDTTINVPALPLGYTRYVLVGIRISNASHALGTATCSVFTGAGGTGLTLCTANTLTVTATTDAATNNTQQIAGTQIASLVKTTTPSIFFRITAAEGAAATATVTFIFGAVP